MNVQGLLPLEPEAAAVHAANELLLLHVRQQVRLQVVALVEPRSGKEISTTLLHVGMRGSSRGYLGHSFGSEESAGM